MSKLQGVYTVMVTPFKQTGEVNYQALKKQAEWQVSQGIHGLLPLGSTGEFAALEDGEKAAVVETVMDAVGGRVPVVVGATAEYSAKAVEYARQAKAAGAAGVMILPSYYFKPSQEEIYEHYARIGETIDLPVIIYNNPFTSGVDIKPETVVRIAAQCPNMAHIKESTGDIKRIKEIRVLAPDITVFCGWEDMAYESFTVGARGWIAPMGNIAPKLSTELYELVAVNRDYDQGWEAYKKMLPILRYLEYSGKIVQTIKYWYDKIGLAGGYPRSPRLSLTDGDRAELDGLFRDAGLIN